MTKSIFIQTRNNTMKRALYKKYGGNCNLQIQTVISRLKSNQTGIFLHESQQKLKRLI